MLDHLLAFPPGGVAPPGMVPLSLEATEGP